MLDLSRMDYDQLKELEDDLGDIIRGMELAAKHDLTGFEPAALELLAEAVSSALDEYERAEALAARLAYERSV